MSKESYIGGDYIETTGGSSKNFAGGSIENSSLADQLTQNGEESGVTYGINEDVPIISTNVALKKFLVHFRRPSSYQGEYGFDWLREEYIFPIVTVTNDNNGNSINAPTALCKNPNRLKQEYLNGAVNNIRPYSITYYPAWLAIFPHTTTAQFAHGSRMHENGINLDLQFDELDNIISDGTEIILESKNQYLKISPKKIAIADVISSGKKSRNVSGNTINYYKLEGKVNIKCTGGTLTQHSEIKVFAKLNTEKVEVGKLMVYKNSVIPKAEIVTINVITHAVPHAQLRNDYHYLFKFQSFNQALIRAEVTVDTNFDINSLPSNDQDVISFKANYINSQSNIGTANSTAFKEDLIKLYEKFGRHKPSNQGIDSNANKRTYLFYTTIKAQDNFAGGGYSRIQGECSATINSTSITWGNAYIIYATALQSKSTVIHEGAHSFSLTHTFQEGAHNSPHIFYKGFTDNVMDYVNQVGVSTRNPFERNDKMNCFFKWQWDIMRRDRSLIFNY